MTDPDPAMSPTGTPTAPTGAVPAGARPVSYALDTPTAPRVELVDQVAAAVLAVHGVAALHGGTFGEAATYLPGRRVRGIRLGEDGTDIHLTLTFGTPVQTAAADVRAAVSGLVAAPVHVTVEDIVPAGPGAPGTS